MADFEEFEFDTDQGSRILVMDESAISQLKSALSTMRVPISQRKAILSHKQKVPPLLYERFRRMMEKRLGESPVRIDIEGKSAKIETKASRGRAKKLSIAEQIKIKERKRNQALKQGMEYRDVIPIMTGPTVGRRKGEPTNNVFAVGTYRGTTYIIEQISAPIPMPKVMPKSLTARKRLQEAATSPYRWQARVIGHPWTKVRRGPGVSVPRKTEAQAAGSIRRELATSYRIGDLTTHSFPVFEGKDGWKDAKRDVENAIDRSYEYRVEKGHVPPELERFVKEEKGREKPGVKRSRQIRPRARRKGKAFDPTGSRENPKNPAAEVHQKMGEELLAESEKLWERYCKNLSNKTLLDAYRVLELACQEFEYTGDNKRKKQAKAGIRAARTEIISKMKSPKKK
jgi:hypothetical protein